MEMSGQLHTPATLPAGKEPLVPTGQEAGWTPHVNFNAGQYWKNFILVVYFLCNTNCIVEKQRTFNSSEMMDKPFYEWQS
jgi:hypothetical protein